GRGGGVTAATPPPTPARRGAARGAWGAPRREEYGRDIDVLRLASEGILDHVIDFDDLRPEVERRLAVYATRERPRIDRHNAVHPV
ncbi:MAG: hypothetical protein K6V73_12445, partial [Firmicutes bacterium]|nr:hypothetical protein [Bacillota bacterium]